MLLKGSPVYSVIDIGTNTCLLLIGQFNNNELIKIFEAQEVPRLGKDIYINWNISQDSFQRAIDVLKKYKNISNSYNAKKILAFGTAALRAAKNAKEFSEYVKQSIGIQIIILSGKQEAKYGYEGAIFDFDKSKQYAVLDIGGGSTEISFMEENKLNSVSMDIGSVKLYEEFFRGNFSEKNISEAKSFIQENFKKMNFKIRNAIPIGIAGTITTLSALKNGLKEFDEGKIHKNKLTLREIENIFERLIQMTEDERLNLGEFMKGRSDIIICGALILMEIMNQFNFDYIIVSTKGLRYGLLLNIVDFN